MGQIAHDSTTAQEARAPLLDAAEEVFAENGFEGAGMKAIARAAGVSQSLLHYHFGTKEALYADVIGRRARAINEERAVLLEQVDLEAPDAVARIFRAFLAPPLGPRGGGMAFARIFSGLVAGGARDHALIEQYYDATAHRFIDALCAAQPGATRQMAAHAYTMALGGLVILMPGSERTRRLAGSDAGAIHSREESLDHLIHHACGGFAALVAATQVEKTLGGDT